MERLGLIRRYLTRMTGESVRNRTIIPAVSRLSPHTEGGTVFSATLGNRSKVRRRSSPVQDRPSIAIFWASWNTISTAGFVAAWWGARSPSRKRGAYTMGILRERLPKRLEMCGSKNRRIGGILMAARGLPMVGRESGGFDPFLTDFCSNMPIISHLGYFPVSELEQHASPPCKSHF